MNAAISLGIVATIVTGTIVFALFGVRRVRMSPQEFIVGNRSFGTFLLWVLMGGEIYTSFTFLGAAGWAYGFGAPAFYIIAYGTCGYIIGYFLYPAIWRIGKERGLLTSPDFFVARYGSKPLGVAVALLQCVMIVPYVTLQLSALQTFVTIGGYGTFNAQSAAIISFIAITAFVFLAGIRGTAWASLIKDALAIGAVIFVGIALPVHFFGSPAKMFDELLRTHPNALVLTAGSAPHGTIWYVSTVLLTAIGYGMGPGTVAAVYSARSDMALRRNAMLLPIYQLMIPLVLFAGFTALLIAPGLKGPAVDQSFLLVVQRYYPPAVLGLIIGAGALCALIPSTALLLSGASVIAKNVLSDGFNRATSDHSRLIAVRTLVVVIALLALGLWLYKKETLVELLLLYYNGITQFMPAFAFGFLWNRTTAWGVAAGLAGGMGLALYLAAEGVTLAGLNPGFIALGLNVALLVTVSLATQKREPAAVAAGSFSQR